jgi:hypothetical protein
VAAVDRDDAEPSSWAYRIPGGFVLGDRSVMWWQAAVAAIVLAMFACTTLDAPEFRAAAIRHNPGQWVVPVGGGDFCGGRYGGCGKSRYYLLLPSFANVKVTVRADRPMYVTPPSHDALIGSALFALVVAVGRLVSRRRSDRPDPPGDEAV